mgnify:CR=1 FL=1
MPFDLTFWDEEKKQVKLKLWLDLLIYLDIKNWQIKNGKLLIYAFNCLYMLYLISKQTSIKHYVPPLLICVK